MVAPAEDPPQSGRPIDGIGGVVLLKDAVTKHPSILRLNPKRDPLKPCVYVGMTGIPVDHRFENHKNGYKISLGRSEIRGATHAGALRTFEPDAV